MNPWYLLVPVLVILAVYLRLRRASPVPPLNFRGSSHEEANAPGNLVKRLRDGGHI